MSDIAFFVGADHARELEKLWISSIGDLVVALNEDPDAVNSILELSRDDLAELEIRLRGAIRSAHEPMPGPGGPSSVTSGELDFDLDDRPRQYGARDPEEDA